MRAEERKRAGRRESWGRWSWNAEVWIKLARRRRGRNDRGMAVRLAHLAATPNVRLRHRAATG